MDDLRNLSDYSRMSDELAPARVSGWVWLFLAATAATAAQAMLQREAVPYTGTLAAISLLGLAATRAAAGGGAARGEGTSRVGIVGLLLLTLAAGLVDARHGGYGWPFDRGIGAGPAGIALTAAAAVLLSLAVLRRVSRGLRRRRLWPAAVLGVLGLVWLVLNVACLGTNWSNIAPSPLIVLAVLALPAAVVMLVLLAVNAAAATGRPGRAAAFGLLAVLGFAGTTVDAAAGLSILIRPAPVPAFAVVYVPGTVLLPDRAVGTVAVRFDDQALSQVIRAEAYPVNVVTPAIAPAEPDVAAVDWTVDPWQGELNWSTLLPAALASALLLGLAALTEFLFPHR
jgi:hypothetical protein